MTRVFKNFIKQKLRLILIASFCIPVCFAQDEYPYPELTVSPKATKRLEMEYREEKDQQYFRNLWAIQASSLVTLTAGLTHDEDNPDDHTASLGAAVGGGWLAATLLLDTFHKPYRTGLIKSRRIKGEKKSDQLAKERLAEEAIYDAASLGRKLDYLAAVSNGITSIFMLSNVEGETLSEPITIISLFSSVAPLVFSNHWSDVAEKHKSYKKKIFGPITMHPDLFEQDGELVTGIRMGLSF